MKSLLWCSKWGLMLGLFVELAGSSALAENHYAPLLCPREEIFLQIQNSSSEAQSFWFQALGETPFTESYGEVKAGGTLNLPASEHLAYGATAMALKTQNAALSFKATCKGTAGSWAMDRSTSPWRKLRVTSAGNLKFYIANLSQQINPLQVTYRGSWGILGTQTLTLPEIFSTQEVSLVLPRGTREILFRAEGRWSGKVLSTAGAELVLEEERKVLASVPPTTRYFLFASQDASTPESFVVPMTNEKLIQESLDQISTPGTGRLLVARIEKSLTGVNRDFSSAAKSPWSWQVVEAQNYADFAHITCDGTPQTVEDRLNSWLGETGGTICFWNYRVVRELSPAELQR